MSAITRLPKINAIEEVFETHHFQCASKMVGMKFKHQYDTKRPLFKINS